MASANYCHGPWLISFARAQSERLSLVKNAGGRTVTPITVLSGYRHPYTNARTERAALNSLHMLGQAVDIRIPGVSASRIAQLGKYLSAGGVGYYPADGFTHLDCGKLRTWLG
ncbi:MAG: YcbK family protein [Pseudomonadales bacterium]